MIGNFQLVSEKKLIICVSLLNKIIFNSNFLGYYLLNYKKLFNKKYVEIYKQLNCKNIKQFCSLYTLSVGKIENINYNFFKNKKHYNNINIENLINIVQNTNMSEKINK